MKQKSHWLVALIVLAASDYLVAEVVTPQRADAEPQQLPSSGGMPGAGGNGPSPTGGSGSGGTPGSGGIIAGH